MGHIILVLKCTICMLLYGPTLYWSAQYACYYMGHIVLKCTIFMLLYGPKLYWSAQYACYYMVLHCTEEYNMHVIIWSHIVLKCTICMLLYGPTLYWSAQYACYYMVLHCTEVYSMHVIIWAHIVLKCTICMLLHVQKCTIYMLLYGPTLYWSVQYACYYMGPHCTEVYNMHVIIILWSYIVLMCTVCMLLHVQKCTICMLWYGPTLYWSVQYARYYMVLHCT
jgi:hypothetical protein